MLFIHRQQHFMTIRSTRKQICFVKTIHRRRERRNERKKTTRLISAEFRIWSHKPTQKDDGMQRTWRTDRMTENARCHINFQWIQHRVLIYHLFIKFNIVQRVDVIVCVALLCFCYQHFELLVNYSEPKVAHVFVQTKNDRKIWNLLWNFLFYAEFMGFQLFSIFAWKRKKKVEVVARFVSLMVLFRKIRQIQMQIFNQNITEFPLKIDPNCLALLFGDLWNLQSHFTEVDPRLFASF